MRKLRFTEIKPVRCMADTGASRLLAVWPHDTFVRATLRRVLTGRVKVSAQGSTSVVAMSRIKSSIPQLRKG